MDGEEQQSTALPPLPQDTYAEGNDNNDGNNMERKPSASSDMDTTGEPFPEIASTNLGIDSLIKLIPSEMNKLDASLNILNRPPKEVVVELQDLLIKELSQICISNLDFQQCSHAKYTFRYAFDSVTVDELMTGQELLEHEYSLFEKRGLKREDLKPDDILIKAGIFTKLVKDYLFRKECWTVAEKLLETNTYSVTCKQGVRLRFPDRRDIKYIRLRECLSYVIGVIQPVEYEYSVTPHFGSFQQPPNTSHFQVMPVIDEGNNGIKRKFQEFLELQNQIVHLQQQLGNLEGELSQLQKLHKLKESSMPTATVEELPPQTSCVENV